MYAAVMLWWLRSHAPQYTLGSAQWLTLPGSGSHKRCFKAAFVPPPPLQRTIKGWPWGSDPTGQILISVTLAYTKVTPLTLRELLLFYVSVTLWAESSPACIAGGHLWKRAGQICSWCSSELVPPAQDLLCAYKKFCSSCFKKPTAQIIGQALKRTRYMLLKSLLPSSWEEMHQKCKYQPRGLS